MHCLIFGVGFYFLPAIIAAVRHTHNSTGILLLNLFLGWTMVGWFVALLMAIFSRPFYGPYYVPYYYRRGW
jgi:Superinfection immunity protein